MTEACFTIARWFPDQRGLDTPSLAEWQRRTALGALLAWLGLFAMLDGPVSLGASWLDWKDFWSGGFLLALPCLLAAWVALRTGPVILRIPPAIALAAVFGLAHGWSTHAYAHGPKTAVLEWLLALLPQFLTLTAGFTFLRHRYGWRIRLRADQGGPDGNAVQFGLRQVFLWTSGTAVILSLVRWLAPDGQIVGDGIDPVSMAFFSILASIAAITFIPLMFLVLGQDSRRRLAAWTVVSAAISAVGFSVVFVIVAAMESDLSEVLSMDAVDSMGFVGVTCAGWLLVATIALVVFRLCGYRLMQTGNTKTRDVTPEAPTTPWRGGRQETQDAHEQAVAPPDGAIRCGWIVALLAFGFVALLGPAYAVLSDRSRVAQDRESEQEWKAVGIIAQVQDGRVTSMAFSPGKPISQAALEKFRAEADKIGVRSLALSGQPITDEELRHLSALKELRHLRLDRTRITDAGLVHLVRLEGLESLDLAHTQVTDEGLKTLARMPSLTTLGFDGTRIGDAGLTHLAPLRRLEVIYLAKTSATQQGIATFESASPERRVIQQGLENLIRQLGATGACLADWD